MALGPWAAALAALAAAAAVALKLLWAPPAQASFLCGPESADACAMDGVRQRFSQADRIRGDAAALRAVATGRLAKARADGRAPALLYVGPHYTVHELLPGGLFDYAAELSRWQPRMVFVDPNPRVIPLLHEKLTSLGIPENATQVLHAAVCDKDGEQSFYMASERLFRDRHMDEAARRELEFGMSMIRGYTVGAGVPEEYVEEVPVPCLTPRSLLERVGLAPAGPDLLLIDAEGYDIGIVERLMEVDGFHPAAMAFEWSGVYKMVSHQGAAAELEARFNGAVKPMLTSLARAGYRVYQHEGDLWALAGA